MLLLVTIGLVLVGAVSLVIGFVSNSLGPIYLSIACSVIAGIVLVVFSRMSRRQEATTASPASTPEAARASWAPSSASTTAGKAPVPEPSSAPARVTAPPAPPPTPAPSYRPEPRRTTTMSDAADATLDEPVPAPLGDDFDFPIEGYDNLRASQILERLGDLDLDELDMVREREEQGKNRATIIRRVDTLIDELEAGEDAVAAPVAAGRAAFEAPAAEPAEPEPMAMGAVPSSPAGTGSDGDFPIEGYDELSVDEIISMLDDLDDDELDMVAEREEQGFNRVEILDYIDSMFEEIDDTSPAAPIVTPPPPPPEPPAAAKKAPARKSPAAKAAPRKAAAAVKTPAAPAAKAGGGRIAADKSVAKGAGRPAAAKKGAGAPLATKTPGRKAGAATKAAKEPAARTATKKTGAAKTPAKKVGAAKKR